MSVTSLSPSAAAAVLASRAETPIRNAPVTSLSRAQRPVSSSASSQRAICPGNCAFPSVARVVTTSESEGMCLAPSRSGAGHISAMVSEESPTKSRDNANSTGSVRSVIRVRNTFGLAYWKAREPVSAASAKPRSGSGVLRK